ncbi:glycerophosphodiester phosphodiesterase [Levilactobacillus sp. N40-8-2]|uniref:glycerophosphodiester phosphodiesterase n=1 Tax=Levilactobacillus muriae TaxID=3238987 RepID=UPI0038B2839A
MLGFGRRLVRSWRVGLVTPGMLLGWEMVAGLFALVRWCGQQPGWSVSLVLAAIALAVGIAGQFTQLARLFTGTPIPDWQTSWQLAWRYKWLWLLVELCVAVLALPLGSWGLSSRILVRLPLAASWVNFVSLHRRPVVMVAAVIYLLLAGYILLWGPRHFRRLTPQLKRPGTVGQMAGGLLVCGMFTFGWWLISEGLVWGNRLGGRHASAQMAASLLAVSLAFVLLLFAVTSILGVITVVWSWCGQPNCSLAIVSGQSHRHWWPVVGGLVCLGLVGAVVQQTLTQRPQFANMALISHRGVDHAWGVQNTIVALRHVSRERPTYVEMDLHETKDHQWVVLHDENLRVLAARNVTPHQLTLRQLERLTVHENGQSTRLAGWPDYLRAAERLHQPLMVELKTTPQDSAEMTRRFARQYGQRLVRDHDVVHSLDYRVVTQLRRRVPRLKVGYILPFNWVAPQSVPADFYSFQRISASQQFIVAAHQMGVPAYIWTPDSRVKMTRMWALGADGQITNELRRLRSVTQQAPQRNGWAVLQNFIYSY